MMRASRRPNLMIDRVYYDRLEIDGSASLDEVKAAYHRAAKKHHPDLFPDHERDRRQLAMMKVNEAYMRIVQARARDSGVSVRIEPDTTRSGADASDYSPISGAQTANPATEAQTSVAHPRDPAYTHYKLGFVWYTRGCTELYRKDPKIVRRQLAELKTYNYYVLDLALKALVSFERAYNYFLVVVEQHPQSIWVTDASAKLRRIQRFNDIYHRICENTARSLAVRERFSSRSKGSATGTMQADSSDGKPGEVIADGPPAASAAAASNPSSSHPG